jgi:hypothetical protein
VAGLPLQVINNLFFSGPPPDPIVVVIDARGQKRVVDFRR